MSIYEQKFVKTDKTDAILVVGDKKLHVNKALFSIHSDYFNTLFNSDFKEKSMKEIPIDDVTFEDFAALLSLINPDPILPTKKNCEKLLELSERFLLPAAKRHVELYICSTQIDKCTKLKLGDKYNLNVLIEHSIQLFTEKSDFWRIHLHAQSFRNFTKAKLYDRYFSLFVNNL